MRTSQPYRSPAPPTLEWVGDPPDVLRAGSRGAKAFLVVWSLLRVAVCSLRGLDLEGLIALFIVVATVGSLTSRRLLP